MDKKRLKIVYVAPQTEFFSCEPFRMVAASDGNGGAGTVTPDPGGDIDDGFGNSKGLARYLLESPSFGSSHSDVWDGK